jgi:hypothetical protein
MVDAMVRISAACANAAGFPAEMVCGHKEWTPRKIDPHTLSMTDIRRRVAALLAPPITTPPPQEDDDMIREWHEVYLGASPDSATWSKPMRASYAWHTDAQLRGRSLLAIHGDFVATAKAAGRV